MKTIFEEYGKGILVAIVVVAVFSLIFGGVKILDVMGRVVDVEAELAHSKSEEEVDSVTLRPKPSIYVADSVTTRLYSNEIFKPLASVSCIDANGTAITPTIVEIVFIDANSGSRVNVSAHYDANNDEFDIETVIGKPGTLAVTYKASDSYNISTTKTISFVVDAVVKS